MASRRTPVLPVRIAVRSLLRRADPARYKSLMTADDVSGTVIIYETERELLSADHLGLRTSSRQIAWSDISGFADASTQDNRWALLIVMRDQRKYGSGFLVVPPRGSPAATKMAEAVRQVAARYGVTAELTGFPMWHGKPAGDGFYEDPGGQASVRYWNGTSWSPLLSADVPEPGIVRHSHVSWSELPSAGEPWTYPATEARRMTVIFALTTGLIVAVAGLVAGLYAAGLVAAQTWWLLCGLVIPAHYSIQSWKRRGYFRRLNKAVN
jgi:Protein of unknown function (DUF2510)